MKSVLTGLITAILISGVLVVLWLIYNTAAINYAAKGVCLDLGYPDHLYHGEKVYCRNSDIIRYVGTIDEIVND
jgi:hypothetical protein